MSWWEAAILGLVQGLTEFLPVSSSGHLVLGQHLLGVDLVAEGDATFEIFVHFGTALSICTVYWPRLRAMCVSLMQLEGNPFKARKRYHSDEHVRTGWYMAVAVVPAAVVYFCFSDIVDKAFADPRLASGLLLVTGALLVVTVYCRSGRGQFTTVKALIVGISQAAAILPGISRSGATICAALYQNVEARRAADFSFLILLPVVLGGVLLKAGDLVAVPSAWLPVVVGTMVAFLSGIVAIRVVLGVVRRGHLHYFAYYCFIVGTVGLLLL